MSKRGKREQLILSFLYQNALKIRNYTFPFREAELLVGVEKT